MVTKTPDRSRLGGLSRRDGHQREAAGGTDQPALRSGDRVVHRRHRRECFVPEAGGGRGARREPLRSDLGRLPAIVPGSGLRERHSESGIRRLGRGPTGWADHFEWLPGQVGHPLCLRHDLRVERRFRANDESARAVAQDHGDMGRGRRDPGRIAAE